MEQGDPKPQQFGKLMQALFKDVKEKQPGGEKPAEENSLFKKTSPLPKQGALKKFFSGGFIIKTKKELFSTGLDIGTSAVKSVVLSSNDGVQQLAAVGIEEISHENFESASRPKEVAEKLKRLQEKNFIKGKVFVSMALPNLLVEFMYLPVMPDDELGKAIRWEAREKLLIDEQNYVIDYLCLGEVEVAQEVQKEVLFFSCPRKDILENYSLLTSLGVKPGAIRPDFLASFQAFVNKSLWRDDEVVGFLDMGAGFSSFSIIARGYVHFNRRLNISGDSITRSIADYCRISYEEAEREKREVGMSRMALEEDRREKTTVNDPRVRISHAMGLHLDQMLTELQYSFNYYSLEVSSAPVNKMDRLILTGGGASVKGICDFLRGRLGVPVEVANPFNYVQSKSTGLDFAQFLNNGSRFATAIGLARGDKLT